MKKIKIIGRGKYIPQKKVDNTYLSEKFKIDKNQIYDLTGIDNRWYAEKETLEDMAYMASIQAIKEANINENMIDLIVVASSSTSKIMPGISFLIQSKLNIQSCMCLDVLGGCNGYINALDIARNYIAIEKANVALVIGVDKLSEVIDEKDYSTSILLGDGAGATIIAKTDKNKLYNSYIQSKGQEGDLLVYEAKDKLIMQGKKIYKYAVKEVPTVIQKVLDMENLNLKDIKYILLHQSNQRIMDAVACRLKCDKNKFITNIKEVGNTFCASIPIVLSDINLEEGDKIMLVGYGGGMNTGCIILEY